METGWTEVTSKHSRSKSKSDSEKSRTPPPKTQKVYVWQGERRRKVDLYRPDGTTLIMTGINMKKLRRFSLFAQAHTPLDSSTFDASEPAFPVIMPRCGGQLDPTVEAIEWLVNWLVEHAEDERTPALHFKNMKMNLRQAVNVYATSQALQVTVKMEALRAEIHKIMVNKPIFHHELKTILSVLPLEHGLVKSAVQSLTYFYVGNRISTRDNEALESAIYQDPEVGAMFDAELTRQKGLQAEGTKRSHQAKRAGKRGPSGEQRARPNMLEIRDHISTEPSSGGNGEEESGETVAIRREAKHRAEEAAAVARKLDEVRQQKLRFMQFGISSHDADMVYGSTMREMLVKL